MQRTAPPFRADQVGSLLRPPALKEARAKRARNEITAEALRAIEDREIEKAIKNGDFEAVEWHYEQEDHLFARLKASLEVGAETRAALAKCRRKIARERTAARWHAQKAAKKS